MSYGYLTSCCSYYEKNLLSQFGSPVGSTIDEIDAFEKHNNISLPEAHKQFLLWAGNDYKGVFRGSEWFLKDIVENNICLPELLTENGICFSLDRPFVCFFSHQGYMAAWYFLENQSNSDPECHFFTEGGEYPAVVNAGRFSQFVLKELRGAVEVLR